MYKQGFLGEENLAINLSIKWNQWSFEQISRTSIHIFLLIVNT